MLSYLQFGEEWFGPLRLFQFISIRAIFAGITALILGFLLGPILIKILQGIGAKQAFRDETEVGKLATLHESKAKTPTMGGALDFWFSFYIYTFICRTKYLCNYGYDGLCNFDNRWICR